MSTFPIRIAQVSDIHLFAERHAELLGVNTFNSFTAIFELLKKEKDALDLIILSGDLSQDGSAISYQQLAHFFDSINVPTYYFAGNHDNPNIMEKEFKGKNISASKQIMLDGWQIILLNSQKSGAVEGFLDISQLDFLKKCLNANPEHHAIVMLHHHPVPVNCAWLDKLDLSNADEFWQIIDDYSQVNTVLFGHIHQQFESSRKNVRCLSVPSTCIQFKVNSNDFALENLPPGYRYIELLEDGSLQTSVIRASNYIGKFDENAKGY